MQICWIFVLQHNNEVGTDGFISDQNRIRREGGGSITGDMDRKDFGSGPFLRKLLVSLFECCLLVW